MLKKWLIVLVMPFVFQIFFLGVLLKSQGDRTEAQRKAIHSKDVLSESATLSRLLVEARDEMLSQMVSSNQPKSRFDASQRNIRIHLSRLRELVEDNRRQDAVLNEIEAKTTRFLDWLAETDRLARSGEMAEATRRFRSTQDRITLDEVTRSIDAFLAVEHELDIERTKELARTVWTQNGIIVSGAVLSLLMAIALVWTFNKDFSRRMEILAENARRLVEGKPLVDPLVGRDEIVQLDTVFHTMAKTLKEREQENEMFIYSVSHDLRSPLVNLQGFSRELTYMANDLRKTLASVQKSPEMDASLERLLDRDMASAIHFIQNAVSRLSAIIDSLLRLSRAGRVEYRLQSLNMDEILSRVVAAQNNSTSEKGASIVVQPLDPAWGDATTVEQIFANLLSNSVKYLDPARPGQIEVGQDREGSDATAFRKYYVKDNGLGIAEAHQTKLFLAFQRLHPSVAEGEGIGLALVKRMVERHGGRIWVESQAGSGSTFFVTLPIPSEPEEIEKNNGAIATVPIGERL